MNITPSTGNIGKASFIYKSNNPPYEPSNPIPPDGAENWTGGGLCWTGGDPDGDDVVYDVYFGNCSPPPQIVADQSHNCTDPGILKFNTTYYWKIVAWDVHGASTPGPIWSFTTKGNSSPVPKIDCHGVNLTFNNVDPGTYVIGQIRIQNVGDPGSFLNWKVDTMNVPTWGTWKFIPDNGTNLSQGDIAICDVEVQMCNEVGEYTGVIFVYNSDDLTDFCEIFTWAWPPSRATLNTLFLWFLEQFPFLEVFLRAMNLLR